SVDTSKSEVARQALDNGALIVNDITALNGDPGMLRIVKRYKAAVALMHMKGRPHTMQKNPRYGCFMREVCGYLKQAMDKALEAGVDRKRIILDPGIGFGKSLEHNLEIIKSLGRLKALGQPILIGLSRKSFLGKITGKETVSRVFAGISANCLAVINGARIVRVHDVQETRDSLKVLDRILKCQ
ncbi:MAG TPA: dihydropteroate synthase, partial [Candidatus Omnitrophota bacterium]|nr:dihydropteroate synthase [Candidatus Omnitrophota bacterium]